MSTTTLDPDDIATEAQLDEYLGGQLRGHTGLLPPSWEDAKPARRFALESVMAHLRRLAVPIYEHHLLDPTELRDAVLFGAAAHLYRLAITRGGDVEVFAVLEKRYSDLFKTEVATLAPKVSVVDPEASGPDALIPGRRSSRSFTLVRR